MHRDNREYLYCLAKHKDIKVYDMSMHKYNFELEGEYCEADINNYFPGLNHFPRAIIT